MQAIQTSLLAVLVGLLLYKYRTTVPQVWREKVTRMFWHYCWGCFSAGMNGASMTIKGSFGVAAGASLSPQQVQPLNLTILLSMFLGSFALNAVDWFTKNPLPTDLGTTPPFTPPTP
jgi:hypothetical protein